MTASAEFVTQITRVQRQLHAFILSMVWNATEADDVLQQTNLVLWEKSSEFDASRPFLTWAMRFAQWQTLAWLKSRRRQQQRLVIDDGLAKLLADEAVADEQAFEARRNALASCLQKLRPEQRELIARRYEPEASVNALAEVVGVTAKALSDRLRRIRQGLMQLMPETQKLFGVKNPYNVGQNVEAGTKLLKQLLVKYRNDIKFAATAYNAGETAVERYRGVPPYEETQNYVRRVTQLYQHYRKAG